MENNITKIDLKDVAEIAYRVAKTGEYDYDATADVCLLGENRILPEADKCVLGLAYTFWSLKNKKVKDDKRNHKFSIHDFWASACAMESVFKRYGMVDCGFKSTAPFVKTTIDAVFVIINSMSRGFNITFDKAFGGDSHLRYLASIFTMTVCRHYFESLGIADGDCEDTCSFSKFREMFPSEEDISDWKELRTLHSQFLSWLRVRTHRAFNVFCDTTSKGVADLPMLEKCFQRSIPETMLSDRIVVRESNTKSRLARQLRLKEREIAKKKGEREDLNIGFEPEPEARKDEPKEDKPVQDTKPDLDKKCECGGKCHCQHHDDGEKVEIRKCQPSEPDYDSISTCTINGHQFVIKHVRGTARYYITSDEPISDEELRFAKSFGLIPMDANIVKKGTFDKNGNRKED